MFNFSQPIGAYPYAYSWSSIPQPHLQPGAFSVQVQQKYKRTWTTQSIHALVTEYEAYCQATGKSTESLALVDFQIIAERLPQTPQQCFTKFKEIQATGSMKPGVWRKGEEDLLVLLKKEGAYKWSQIAKAINHQFHNQVKVRTGKQCKEKWFNHLSPEINRGPWSCKEDLAILLGYLRYGNRWSLVAKSVSNRLESAVKNRVKSLINKEKQLLRGQETQETLVESLIRKLEDKLT